MASCAYCNSTILFGGVTAGPHRFCNDNCHQNGFLLSVSGQIPEDVVEGQLAMLHQNPCPKCQGRGPVDVHTSHLVFSVLVMTRWSSKPQVCCRSCGVKSQVGYTFASLLFGWWGFPWGLIFTPVQVTKNLVGIFNPPNPLVPSPQLAKIVRLNVASQVVAVQQAEQAGQAR